MSAFGLKRKCRVLAVSFIAAVMMRRDYPNNERERGQAVLPFFLVRLGGEQA